MGWGGLWIRQSDPLFLQLPLSLLGLIMNDMIVAGLMRHIVGQKDCRGVKGFLGAILTSGGGGGGLSPCTNICQSLHIATRTVSR